MQENWVDLENQRVVERTLDRSWILVFFMALDFTQALTWVLVLVNLP